VTLVRLEQTPSRRILNVVTLAAVFIADTIGLDFLNSISTPVDVPVDAIDGGEGLLTWLKDSGMVPAKALEQFRAHATPGELDGVAAQARSLRE
jgi:hypothetical protein